MFRRVMKLFFFIKKSGPAESVPFNMNIFIYLKKKSISNEPPSRINLPRSDVSARSSNSEMFLFSDLNHQDPMFLKDENFD